MKKQTQKKWTEKLKEGRKRIKSNNYGITLIALVITVIVLLILAGISISMLSGDNSILSRTTEAKTKTGNAQDEETISLAYLAAITGNYTNGDDISTTLTSELDKTYGSGKVSVTKDGSTYTISIDGKGDYTIDANGKVEKQGPAVTYANERIVTSSDGTGENVAAGSKTPTTDKLYIYFEASVENGTTSISPSVPFEITENGTYNFTITSTVNGENFTTTKSISVNQYAARAGIKIGDYISYTSPTESVTFNSDETGYANYATPETLNRKTLFRVLDIDDEGNMELIGAMTSSDQTIYFSGAQGYNNAVYVLNKKCSDLYKNEAKGITARSINEEDITSRFNSTGTGKMTTFIANNMPSTGIGISNVDTTRKTITYIHIKAHYPNIFQYEAGGLIGTIETGIPESNPKQTIGRSISYIGYGEDGILTSEDTIGEPATAIPQSLQSETTLTVPFTYSYTIHDEGDFDYTDVALKTAYNSMFFGMDTYCWLASRCICCANTRVAFGMCWIHASDLAGLWLYYSDDSDPNSLNYCVCPIVSIPATVKVTPCTGDNSSTNTHTVVTN